MLRETGENPRLPGVKLPPDLRCMDTMESLRESELVVFAAPSFAVRETARQAAALLRDGTVLVSAAKGIEKGTSLRMTEIIGEETGAVPLLLHSCHNVTRSELESGVTYVELMRQNIENLRKGLDED